MKNRDTNNKSGSRSLSKIHATKPITKITKKCEFRSGDPSLWYRYASDTYYHIAFVDQQDQVVLSNDSITLVVKMTNLHGECIYKEDVNKAPIKGIYYFREIHPFEPCKFTLSFSCTDHPEINLLNFEILCTESGEYSEKIAGLIVNDVDVDVIGGESTKDIYLERSWISPLSISYNNGSNIVLSPRIITAIMDDRNQTLNGIFGFLPSPTTAVPTSPSCPSVYAYLTDEDFKNAYLKKKCGEKSSSDFLKLYLENVDTMLACVENLARCGVILYTSEERKALGNACKQIMHSGVSKKENSHYCHVLSIPYLLRGLLVVLRSVSGDQSPPPVGVGEEAIVEAKEEEIEEPPKKKAKSIEGKKSISNDTERISTVDADNKNVTEDSQFIGFCLDLLVRLEENCYPLLF